MPDTVPTLRIALDAMGGDFAPAAVVEGSVAALHELGLPLRLLLVGDEPRIRAELAKGRALPAGSIEVRHTTQVVEMDEHPGQAMRQKKDSSLRVCFELCKKGEADAMVSAGNSGACMAGALFVLGRLDHVERPAIAAVLPSVKGRVLLIDAGANTECKPVHLAQFALMGEVYARRMFGIERPKVAVLSNGEEATKGTELTRAAAEALRGFGPSFVGYAEGKDINAGEVDVVATDGFTGNVVLKAIEGTAQALIQLLRQNVEANKVAMLGMALARPALRRFKATIDWDEYGGAPLIGVDGVGIVAHGRSGPKAIRNAIRVAAEAAAVGMGRELSEAALKAQELCGVERRGKGNGKRREGAEQPAAEAQARGRPEEADGGHGGSGVSGGAEPGARDSHESPEENDTERG